MTIYMLVLSVFTILAVISFSHWIFKAPERGVYASFFASGILQAVNLGPLREKVGLTEIVILLTWFAMLVNRNWRYDRVPLSSYQRLSLFSLTVFILVYWVSFFLNNSTYYDNIIGSLVEISNLTYGALMVFTVVILIQTPKQWNGCLVGWLAGSAVVSLVGLWAMTGTAPSWTLDEFTGRICSTLKAENQVPSFLIPILFIAIIWISIKNVTVVHRSLLLMLIAGMSITLIGTGSRTAFLLLVLTLIALGLFIIIHARNRVLLKGYLSFSLLLCLMSLVIYVSAAIALYDGNYALGHTPAWQRPVVTLYETLNGNRILDETREHQANLVLTNADSALFLGNGPKLYGSKFKIEEIHNTYAGVFFESGIFGLITLLLFLLFSILTAQCRSSDVAINLLVSAAVVGFSLLLLYGMTMYGLRQRNIWLMAGLLIAVPSIIKRLENDKE